MVNPPRKVSNPAPANARFRIGFPCNFRAGVAHLAALSAASQAITIMLPFAIAGVFLAVAFFAGWYTYFVRFNRRRGCQVLSWLQGAIADYGQIAAVTWRSPSQFAVRLTLFGHDFRQPVLDVRLAPRQTPFQWAIWHFRRRQETLTFQANLSGAPGDTLEISRIRWSPFARQPVPNPASSPRHTVATLFISTQPTCDAQLSSRINGVVATRDFECLAVSFRPSPPHFSVTFSLQETLRRPCGELAIFDSLRDLAQGSPTSRM